LQKESGASVSSTSSSSSDTDSSSDGGDGKSSVVWLPTGDHYITWFDPVAAAACLPDGSQNDFENIPLAFRPRKNLLGKAVGVKAAAQVDGGAGKVFSDARTPREVFCGNLAAGQVQPQMLGWAFDNMFKMLRDYHLHYPGLESPIISVNIHGMGTFGLVEFVDETLASTAMEMDGFMLCGCRVSVRRPYGHKTVPSQDRLDTTVLRKSGLLLPVTGRTF